VKVPLPSTCAKIGMEYFQGFAGTREMPSVQRLGQHVAIRHLAGGQAGSSTCRALGLTGAACCEQSRCSSSRRGRPVLPQQHVERAQVQQNLHEYPHNSAYSALWAQPASCNDTAHRADPGHNAHVDAPRTGLSAAALTDAAAASAAVSS